MVAFALRALTRDAATVYPAPHKGRPRTVQPPQTAIVFETVGSIARRLGVPTHRVLYRIKALGIRHTGRAGIARVFSEDDVQRIAEALRTPKGKDDAATS